MRTRPWPMAALLIAAALVVPAGAPVWAQPASDPRVHEARRLFDETQYEAVLVVLDRVIGDRPAGDIAPALRRELASAHELRGRARFNLGNVEGATDDFRAVLALAPDYRLPETSSPRALAAFEALRATSVGGVLLQVAPGDAEVLIDGAPVDWRQGMIALGVGQHRLTATRAAHAPLEQIVTVAAGPAMPVTLTLTRTSATATLVTVPDGVEILLDGAPQGATRAGNGADVPPEWRQKFPGVPPTGFSAPMLLAGIGPGEHRITLRRPCHRTEERLLKVDVLDDRTFEPIVLAPAVGTLDVPGSGGATLYVDGVPRGPAPLAVTDVCEGPHIVEVRSPHGRLFRRLNVAAGSKTTLDGVIKPAIAVVSEWSPKPRPQGATDMRLEVERVIGEKGTVTLFAPADETMRTFATEQRVSPDWLAFDREGRPTGGAASLSEQARQEFVTQLARKLDVQGLASVTIPADGTPDEIWLAIFALGSARPDVLVVHLDDPASVGRAVSRLGTGLTLLRPSLGVLPIDVLDAEGAVVAAVQTGGPGARAGIGVGDRLTLVNKVPIKTAADLQTYLESQPTDAAVDLTFVDRTNATRQARVQPLRIPDSLSVEDRTQLFNKVAIDLRSRLATATPTEQPVIQLNLAVALMGTGSWAEALRLLQATKLPPGPGVSDGTVQYLTGICFEELRQFADAERAFRAAAGSDASLLMQSGPRIKELAEQRAKALSAAR